MNRPNISQQQKQTQSISIAPQLRNSLKILQSASFDLRTAILSELQRNPLLEELPIDSVSVEAESELIQDEEPDTRNDELDFDNNDFSILEKISNDYSESESSEFGMSASEQELKERREHFLNSLTQNQSLQQHLIDQVAISDYDEKTKDILILIIGSLNESGYLSENPSNLALQFNVPYPSFINAYKILKSFDPPGIGAKDLQECLLIQLERNKRKNSLAYDIIKKCFILLTRRRIQDISKQLKIEEASVEKAIEEIANMDPTPGKRFSPDTNTIIEPDVKIYLDDEKWKIDLNNEYIPKLRISKKYKDLLSKGTLNKKEKEYLVENMRSGKFLISSLEQRQDTLKKISERIIYHQPNFFTLKNPKLKALKMQKIADDIGVHETTISRAIANKFVKTPHGVFPLKHFFNTGFTSQSGESIANQSIKEKIERIIQKEDTKKPISDQSIVKELKSDGIEIARRTVAKYREQLGILPTHLRRRFDK